MLEDESLPAQRNPLLARQREIVHNLTLDHPRRGLGGTVFYVP